MALSLCQEIYDFEIYANDGKKLIKEITGTPLDVIEEMGWKTYKDIHPFTITIKEYNDIMKIPVYEGTWFGREKHSKYPLGFNVSSCMKNLIKYMVFKPLLNGRNYIPYIERLENRILTISRFRETLDRNDFNECVRKVVDELGMREIRDRNEFSSHTPCAFLLVYDNYCQILGGVVDTDHSLMKHIEWKLHGKAEELSWLKCGEYELVDVTRVFVKEIPYSDSITEQLEPSESDLRCIREEAQEMYRRELEDDIPDEEKFNYDQCYEFVYEEWRDQKLRELKYGAVREIRVSSYFPSVYSFGIPDEIYRQIVKWSSDSPPFVYEIRNGD